MKQVTPATLAAALHAMQSSSEPDRTNCDHSHPQPQCEYEADFLYAALPQPGQQVAKGERVGHIGSGAHLHTEVALPDQSDALRDRIRFALEPHWLEYGDHPTGSDKEWAEDIADIVLAALATSAAAGEGGDQPAEEGVTP